MVAFRSLAPFPIMPQPVLFDKSGLRSALIRLPPRLDGALSVGYNRVRLKQGKDRAVFLRCVMPAEDPAQEVRV